MALKLSPTRTIIRGDSDKFRITFTKQISSTKSSGHGGCSCLTGLDKTKTNKQPIDITGWSIRFTVRPDVPDSTVIGDEDAIISEDGVILDAENGVAMVYVQSENTTALIPGTYYYDIQVVKPVDEYGYQQVSSIRRGKYVVLGDITRNQDAIATEDFETIHDDVTDSVIVLNAIWGEGSNDKITMSNGLVISDYDGDVVVKADRNALKYLVPHNVEDDGLTDDSNDADDADDGYTI